MVFICIINYDLGDNFLPHLEVIKIDDKTLQFSRLCQGIIPLFHLKKKYVNINEEGVSKLRFEGRAFSHMSDKLSKQSGKCGIIIQDR